MKIIKKSYSWAGKLSKRKSTEFIVLHHAAASSCSPEQIHSTHKNSNGWTGIGYHFYIRKDGTICTGRPIDTVGAHVEDMNSKCIGVCFEGNFEREKMCDVQIKAGKWLMEYLRTMYPTAQIKKHSDFNPTACPGRNFPFDKICEREITDADEIVKRLNKRGIMTNMPLWKRKCADRSNAYYLAKKICNMTISAPARANKLESVNDIVWELHNRGIITDKNLWLKLFESDTDLYWLGFKAANMTEKR